MDNQIIMENYLLVLKSCVEVFVHGTLESNFDDIQSLLKKSLNEIIDCQRKTYMVMLEHGMYKTNSINNNVISECLNKLKQQ